MIQNILLSFTIGYVLKFQKLNKVFFPFVLMNLKRGKKGQFFLIAAVVIIVVVVSVITVSNYTQKKQDVKLYDLGEELGIESQNVLDYGTYSELNEDQMKILMENFIKNYVSYIEAKKNIYFVFGNSKKIYVVGYQEIANESVCVNVNSGGQKCDAGQCIGWGYCRQSEVQCGSHCCDIGQKCENGECKPGAGTCTSLQVQCGSNCCNVCTPYLTIGQTQEFPATNGDISKVVITIAEIEYQFRLKYGENFYFVIWQEIGGEKHVVTSGRE